MLRNTAGRRLPPRPTRPSRGVALAGAMTALLLAGCGSSGPGVLTDSSKASDAEYLNTALVRELTTADAYRQSLPLLKGQARTVAVRFEAQQGEYIDGITKAMRGLGAKVTAEPEELDLSSVRDRNAALALFYELERHALSWDVANVPNLLTPVPAALVAGLAVGHGQHLVVLRQLLGESLPNSVPEAFDGGKVPPPGVAAERPNKAE